jgi:hypothetical protein
MIPGLSPEAQIALARMEEAARNKPGGLYEVALVDEFPNIREMKDELILGMSAWTCTSKRYKLIRRSDAILTPWGYDTPGGVARLYLAVTFPRRRIRCRSAQWARFVGGFRTAPLYCRPSHLVDAVYIDLRAAYWTISRIVGWDCDVMPGQWFSAGRDNADFPFQHVKPARLAVVQSAVTSPATIWTGERIVIRKLNNPHANYVLWGVIQDVLHSVAHEMIRLCDARFVHTDGYIVPAQFADLALGVLERWGLPATLKRSGPATIRTVNAYRIGTYKTGNYDAVQPHRVDNVHPPAPAESDWYRERVQEWSRRRGIMPRHGAT